VCVCVCQSAARYNMERLDYLGEDNHSIQITDGQKKISIYFI